MGELRDDVAREVQARRKQLQVGLALARIGMTSNAYAQGRMLNDALTDAMGAVETLCCVSGSIESGKQVLLQANQALHNQCTQFI